MTQPTREEFLFISSTGKVIFYLLTYASLAGMFYQIYHRAKLWRTGKPIAKASVSRWWKNISIYVLGQKKVQKSRPKSGAPMHMAIFYGFLALFIGTTLLGINTYSPVKFHHGLYYLIYEMTLDVMGSVFIIGVVWALVRRASFARSEVAKPAERKILSQSPNDFWTLALLLVVGLTGFWLEAARMSVNPQTFDWSSPVGHLWAQLQGPIQPETYRLIWWFHMVWIWAFFLAVPRMRLRHIVLAIFSTAGQPEVPMGYLSPISIEDVEATGKIGAVEAADYSRWHLMSLDACMSCGRCTEVCPAFAVGKSLNPKEIVQGLRGLVGTSEAVAPRLTEEALWACTTCNACVEACPVLIRQVDIIVDARRNLVSEGKLAGSSATMLRQTASTGNAWGASKSNREDWMKGLEIPLCRNKQKFEYLFWVGCAGATDPGAVKTTRAVADLLLKAGVDFACLGQEETCTGDPARRVGDEFLFQEQAAQNQSIFERYGVKKVVTACPHCFNSLKNEYGDFGAAMEVWHHTQLLAELVAEGRLQAADDSEGIVLHDPCYLSRINGEVDAPRALMGEKTFYNPDHIPAVQWLEMDPSVPRKLTEPKNFGRKTLCCGAGGGRMWMDDATDQRPSDRRAQELLDTGATTVAVACPFCRIMLEPSLKEKRDDIRLVDLAELLQEANR